jgi:hypothetical protein
MNKTAFGLLLGVIAGTIDISPMIAMKLPLSADISAFVQWVVVGFFIATSALKMNGILKGVLISYLALFPTAILIGQNNPADLIPVFVMTLILGSLLGYFVEKYK